MKVGCFLKSTVIYAVEWLVLNLYIYTMFKGIDPIKGMTFAIIVYLILEIRVIIRIIKSEEIFDPFIQRFLVGRNMLKLVLYYLVITAIQFRLIGFPNVWGREPWRYYSVILSYTGYLAYCYITRRIVHSRSSLIREVMESYPIYQSLGLEEYFPCAYRSQSRFLSLNINFDFLRIKKLPDGWIRMVGHAAQINLSHNPISDLNISDEDVRWFRENRSEITIIAFETDIKLTREEIREYLPEIKVLAGSEEDLNEVLNHGFFRAKFVARNLVMMESSLLAYVFMKWLMVSGYVVYPQNTEELELLKKMFHIPMSESLEEIPADESSEDESIAGDH